MFDHQLTPLLDTIRDFIFHIVILPLAYLYYFVSKLLAYASEHPLSYFFSDTFNHACDHPLFWFSLLFIFRYLRLVIHCISFWDYKPTPIPLIPTLTSQDCTVIIPTVDPTHFEFKECLQYCLVNRPKHIIIATVGLKHYTACKYLIKNYTTSCPDTEITVLPSQIANKRTQVALAIPEIKTAITVLLNDHVLLGRNFLPTALAPFKDPQVGAVGTNKRVRKEHTGLNILSYWNMLGALSLERHNFEIRATNNLDGGIFVISERTSLHRTEILQNEDFLPGFTNERFFFGLFGPLNADDDNYITRFEVSQGWKFKIQFSDDACVETTLGAYPKFIQQCLRWVRTTWRSNSASLFTDRTVWRKQPWCVYAVYITSFFNFALLNDAGLVYLLWNSQYGTPESLTGLGIWIFSTKMVNLWPYFRRHPEDLRMLLGYFAFAYFHSLIKGYALLTFWNCHWGGRDLKAITESAGGGDVRFSKGEDNPAKIERTAISIPGTSKPVVEAVIQSLELLVAAPVTALSGENLTSKIPPIKPTTQQSSFNQQKTLQKPDQTQASLTNIPAPSPTSRGVTKSIPTTTTSPQTSIQKATTSPEKPPSQKKYSSFKPFPTPPNIEEYHFHGPIPWKKEENNPSTDKTNPSKTSPPSDPKTISSRPDPFIDTTTPIRNTHNSYIPPEPSPTSWPNNNNNTTPTHRPKSRRRRRRPPIVSTNRLTPCAHCLRRRQLAILIILFLLYTVLIHYFIALMKWGSGSGGALSVTKGEVPGRLVRDWSRER